MLDLPRAADALNGVRMELIDAALPLLRGLQASQFPSYLYLCSELGLK